MLTLLKGVLSLLWLSGKLTLGNFNHCKGNEGKGKEKSKVKNKLLKFFYTIRLLRKRARLNSISFRGILPYHMNQRAKSLPLLICMKLDYLGSDRSPMKNCLHVIRSGAQDEASWSDTQSTTPGAYGKERFQAEAYLRRDMSSLQHLAKDFSFGDQFLNDKPSEADNEKTTADTEAESMVSVTIQQDISVIPPMTSPVIGPVPRPDSPNVHEPLPTTTTTTAAPTTITTTTTRPLPPQPQQGSGYNLQLKALNESFLFVLAQGSPTSDIEGNLSKRHVGEDMTRVMLNTELASMEALHQGSIIVINCEDFDDDS
ncbi:hypothetical protein Tco_1343598 [Tanacetum coccineum]